MICPDTIHNSIEGMKRELQTRMLSIEWKLSQATRNLHRPKRIQFLLTRLIVDVVKANNLSQCIADMEQRYKSLLTQS